MTVTRRAALGLLAAPALIRAGRAAAGKRVLKISHQFPGGTAEQGDFRDRLVRRFAADVGTRTGGGLAFEIYPGSSLMKAPAQFSALRRGALDLALFPLAYAGGELPEANLGLMPCLVTSYQQGTAWRTVPVGQELEAVLDRSGVRILTWIWQGGGIASRAEGVSKPDDAKGLTIRGGSRGMDRMLKAAGGIASTVIPGQAYAAMQAGALDAAVTSSSSLISFRLEEVAMAVTTARGGSFWFMLEPLLASKQVFDSLTPEQRTAVADAGAAQERFALEAAQADDQALADVYARAGAKVADMTADDLAGWKAVAQDSAWKDFAGRNAACANLLKLAQAAG